MTLDSQEKKEKPPDRKIQQNLIHRAEGKLKLAVDRLVERYPFHAAVVNQMPIIAKFGIGTMAVTFGPECIVLLHEPEFVLATPLRFLVGDLQHEVNHILFHHLLMKPKDFPNEKALIIAQEVTVNEFVKEPIQEWVINLDKYPDLPPMESTLERYKRLDKIFPLVKVQIKLPGVPGKDGKSGQSDIHDVSDPNPGSGGKGDSEEKGKKPDPNAKEGRAFDNHQVWEMQVPEAGWGKEVDEEADSKRKKEMIEEILQQACDQVDPSQIPEEIKEACQQHGTVPGGMLENVHRGGKRADPWTILRRYIGSQTGIRPILTRPPRRFPDLVGVIPAYSRQLDKPRLLIILDTSGSISSSMLSQMDANLRVIAKDHEITIVECDCMIYRSYKFKGRLKEVQGRGGTDLRPPLEEKFLKQHKPDLIVYFTDGIGVAPDQAPKVPLIWALLPPFGQIPFNASYEGRINWGRVVFLKN